MKGLSIVLAVPFVLLPVAASAGGYHGGPVANGGSISGTVTFHGAVPKAKPLPVTKDQGTCGHSVPSQTMIVGKGGLLANAVVYVDKVTSGKPMTRSVVTLDQKGCMYHPHVQAATRGSKIELISSDPILHNAHGALGGKRLIFNVAMPTKGQHIKKKLKKAGLVQITCDAGHTWMKSYVYVFDHPYFAVTGSDGSFHIDDVPPGSYDLVVWQEKLGTKRARVTVTAGGDAKVSLVYP